MKKKLILLVTIIAVIAACKSGEKAAKVNNKPLFTVGDDIVTTGEFVRMFKKNNPKADTPTKQEVNDYLDLYVKFKLKVKEAKELGFDTLKSYQREMEGYRHTLAKPYLTDKAVTDELVDEAQARSEYEVRASHILIRCSPQASPNDTMAAYNKLMDIKKRIENGESFDALAMQYSEDPSAATNKGDLGYFTVFNMIYEFETVAYNTPVGDVSKPFRTQFGYHIVKVTDKRKARGEIKVAHIMIQPKQNPTDADWAEAKEKIEAIKKRMAQDERFEDLAKNFSDDHSTARAGGEVGWLKSINRRFPSEFVDACFALTENGQVSEPIKTEYGYHLIKRLDYKAPPTKEEQEYYINNSIAKDSRSSKGQKAMAAQIMKEKKFTEDKEVYSQMLQLFDSTLLEGRWYTPSGTDEKLLKSYLFTLGKGDKLKGYDVDEFVGFVRSFQSKDPQASVDQKIKSLYDDFVENSVLSYKEEYLREDNSDFDYILTEYEEGILLFEFMQQEVWNKAVTDSVGRLGFYETNKDNYMWKERREAKVYRCQTQAIADSVVKMVARGMTDSAILMTLTKGNILAVQIDYGKFEKGTNEFVDKATQAKGTQNLGYTSGIYPVVIVESVIEPVHKTPKEAQGQLISDYQEHLQGQWEVKLKEKYPVKVNEDELNKAFGFKE